MNKVKRIEITFGAVDTERRDEASLSFAVKYGTPPVNLKDKYGTSDDSIIYDIPTNTTNKYTWPVEVDPNFKGSTNGAPFNLENVFFELQNAGLSSFVPDSDDKTYRASEKLKQSIEEIRIIYK